MKTKKYVFCSTGESQTESAGAALAKIVRGIICVEGDLGAGKTVLARGIAKGLGINEYITSPTFNIINVYETENIIFNHMDAYRMTDPEMLYDIGFDEMVESGDLTVIEWSNLITEAIGEYSVRVNMLRGNSEEKRIIILESSHENIEKFVRSFK
ncbi:MAG: tRNA (adenosine(37)-N6)-threonylcarbamoyltransferase complex ATPase subunit type 1 TsaE [Clostridiales bacterium]|nr:tRNA (adenosine(37)-N6)-threonylcarbamoyltransferase complex ATPase subunit type 1 TsaE [Clostridiales bacterium]